MVETGHNSDNVEGVRGRYRLGLSRRIKKTAQFDRVYSERLSTADGMLVVYAMANNGEKSRVGLSVSKKLGSAVRRNRYKRAMREAFRLSQYDLPRGYDYVLIPRPTAEPCVESYRKSLEVLCNRLHHRHRHKSEFPGIYQPKI